MDPMHLSSITRPKSILVATDLNDLDFLLPVAIDQAKATGAMIWLLHVIPPDAYVSTESGAFPLTKKEKAFRDAEAVLAKAANELKAQIWLVRMKCVAGIRLTGSSTSFANAGSSA